MAWSQIRLTFKLVHRLHLLDLETGKDNKAERGHELEGTQPLLTLCVSAEMLVTPFTLKSNGASG